MTSANRKYFGDPVCSVDVHRSGSDWLLRLSVVGINTSSPRAADTVRRDDGDDQS